VCSPSMGAGPPSGKCVPLRWNGYDKYGVCPVMVCS